MSALLQSPVLFDEASVALSRKARVEKRKAISCENKKTSAWICQVLTKA